MRIAKDLQALERKSPAKQGSNISANLKRFATVQSQVRTIHKKGLSLATPLTLTIFKLLQGSGFREVLFFLLLGSSGCQGTKKCEDGFTNLGQDVHCFFNLSVYP